MGLEDEARTLAAQITARDAAMNDKAREIRTQMETPAPPDWTAELIAMIASRYLDHPVYRVVAVDEARSGYVQETTVRYSLLGRGWCLNPYFIEEQRRTGQPAILLRDGNLYSGALLSVQNEVHTRHVGIPSGIKAALVASKLMTNAACSPEDPYRERYGLGAAAAILAGSAESEGGGLTWYDATRG